MASFGGESASHIASTSVPDPKSREKQQETQMASFGDIASTSVSNPKAGQQLQEIQKASSGGEGASDAASATTSATVSLREAGRQHQQIGGPTESTLPDAPSQRRPGLGEIPRVRALLRRVAGDLFTPQTVLIGPYHQKVGSYYFPSTGLKKKAFHDIIRKHKVEQYDLELELYDLVGEVRECYTCLPDENLDLSPEKKTLDDAEFCTMLLYDGCYLLSFFMDFNRPNETSAGSVESSNLGASSSNGGGDVGGGTAGQMILYKDSTLVRDILYLLENQIPLYVLEAILNYLKVTTVDGKSTFQLISDEVKSLLHQQRYISEMKESVLRPDTSMPSDLLHLVYSYFRRRREDEPPVAAPARKECCPTGRWRRATDYRKYADLKFRRRKFKENEKWSILDMELKGGTLYIPFLRVGADTWTMLRNLMALEEQEENRPVTAYCFFLSQVACTAEDVRLLQGAKILEHFMPSDEDAAKAFAYLSNGVALDIDKLERNYLRHVWHHLHNRCRKWRHNIWGLFCYMYCSNVFYGLVFIIGVIVFLSEVAQAVYAFLSYHKPRHS